MSLTTTQLDEIIQNYKDDGAKTVIDYMERLERDYKGQFDEKDANIAVLNSILGDTLSITRKENQLEGLEVSHPIYYAVSIAKFREDATKDLIKIIEHIGVDGYIHDEKDPKWICIKSILGSPLVSRLNVIDNQIMYQTAMKNKDGEIVWSSDQWYKLNDDDIIQVYTDLYYKLSGK